MNQGTTNDSNKRVGKEIRIKFSSKWQIKAAEMFVSSCFPLDEELIDSAEMRQEQGLVETFDFMEYDHETNEIVIPSNYPLNSIVIDILGEFGNLEFSCRGRVEEVFEDDDIDRNEYNGMMRGFDNLEKKLRTAFDITN